MPTTRPVRSAAVAAVKALTMQMAIMPLSVNCPLPHRPGAMISLKIARQRPARSENRQWIERRSCPFFDSQRRSREQKFVTIEPPRLLDRSLEIEIVENVDAHRD